MTPSRAFLEHLFAAQDGDEQNWSECRLLVGFVAGRAHNVDIALDLLEHARFQTKKMYAKCVWHLGCFMGTDYQSEAAILLMEVVKDWRLSVVSVHGRMRWIPDVISVLKCHSMAMVCSDRRAHCYAVKDDPRAHGRKLVLPCRLAACDFTYDPDHPSAITGQFQAHAVARGVEWCPLFTEEHITEACVIAELVMAGRGT